MKFYTTLLDKFFNRRLTFTEYHDIFLKLGYEVEKFYPVLNANGFVIAKTLDCVPHPNADNLSHCQINYNDQILDVVCGGKNVKSNQWVIYAPVGSEVDGKILEVKDLRGIKSNGMILSLTEITKINPNSILESEKENILEVSLLQNFNTELEDFLYENNLDGYAFELSILPDRFYANNHTLMAKEIAAFLNLEFDSFLTLSKDSSLDNPLSEEAVSLDENVTAFDVVVVNWIKTPLTPNYIKNILYLENIKVTNTMEDIFNFVFIITGISVYVVEKFNSIKIEENLIKIDSKQIDSFTSSNYLIERDYKDEHELEIFAFSSNFKTNPMQIKNLNPLHGLRNARGSNHYLVKKTIKQALKILLRHGYIDYFSKIASYKAEQLSKVFKLELKQIKQDIGFEFDTARVLSILRRLDFEIESHEGNYLTIRIPDYRNDLNSLQDINEEIIRAIGTKDIIPSKEILKGDVQINSEIYSNINYIKNQLAIINIFEAFTYYLIPENYANEFDIFSLGEPLILKSEFNFESNSYRKSLLYSLLEVYIFNYRKNESLERSLNFFEIANIFTNEDYQGIHLGVLIDDLYPIDKEKTQILRQILKNISSYSFSKINFNDFKFVQIESENELFNPYNSVNIFYKDELVGVIGEIHPKILRQYKLIRLDKIRRNLFYLELKIDLIIQK